MKSSKFRGLEYRNHNRLLKEYKGTDGIKTSYVRASGYNIVVSVERNGRRLIAAIFGGKSALKKIVMQKYCFGVRLRCLLKITAPTQIGKTEKHRAKPRIQKDYPSADCARTGKQKRRFER